MENTIYYTYNPVDFIYTGTITDELGLPFYATNIPPLPKIDICRLSYIRLSKNGRLYRWYSEK